MAPLDGEVASDFFSGLLGYSPTRLMIFPSQPDLCFSFVELWGCQQRWSPSSHLSSLGRIEQDPLLNEAPDANAYEFNSSGIVNMLKKLLKKYHADWQDGKVAEGNAAHVQGLRNSA